MAWFGWLVGKWKERNDRYERGDTTAVETSRCVLALYIFWTKPTSLTIWSQHGSGSFTALLFCVVVVVDRIIIIAVLDIPRRQGGTIPIRGGKMLLLHLCVLPLSMSLGQIVELQSTTAAHVVIVIGRDFLWLFLLLFFASIIGLGSRGES